MTGLGKSEGDVGGVRVMVGVQVGGRVAVGVPVQVGVRDTVNVGVGWETMILFPVSGNPEKETGWPPLFPLLPVMLVTDIWKLPVAVLVKLTWI